MNRNNLNTGLSYDDVLIQPQRSPVRHREDVDTSTTLFDTPHRTITLDTPVISANMDTVTEKEMAQAMADIGGVGIIHRYMEPEQHAEQISAVDGLVGGCVGLDESAVDNAQMYVEAGADFICLDVAHGHMDRIIESVENLSSEIPEVPLMVGNVATQDGVKDLSHAGADCVKVGIGPGSACKTRTATGVGVPQFTAVTNAAETSLYSGHAPMSSEQDMSDINRETHIVADGGITCGGDLAKALLGGACAGMIGGLLAGCDEAPGEVVTGPDGNKYKTFRGLASEEARENTEKFEDTDEYRNIEGVSGYQKYVGTVEKQIQDLMDGLRSACSYTGAHTIEEAQDRVEFQHVTPSTQDRNGSHSLSLDN